MSSNEQCKRNFLDAAANENVHTWFSRCLNVYLYASQPTKARTLALYQSTISCLFWCLRPVLIKFFTTHGVHFCCACALQWYIVTRMQRALVLALLRVTFSLFWLFSFLSYATGCTLFFLSGSFDESWIQHLCFFPFWGCSDHMQIHY